MYSPRKTKLNLATVLFSSAALISQADFIDDTTFRGKLRSTYYDVENIYKKDTNQKNHTTGAWTGSVMLDIKSGFAWDSIGLGASLYGVTKLDMKEGNQVDAATNPNTDGGSYQLLNRYNEGFSKLGQAYLHIKQGDDELGGQFKAGRQSIYNALISSSGSRSVPSTWQGYNLNSQFHDFRLGLAYVDQMSLRNEAGFHKLENFKGEHIEYIAGAELGYTVGGLELLYRNAFAKDFLQAHNAKIGYTFTLSESSSLTIDSRYFETKKDGKLWHGDAWGKPTFDDKAKNYSLNAELIVNAWTFVSSVSKTEAKSKDATLNGKVGQYYYDFGKNTHGIWDVPTSGFAEDFLYDGETAWKVGGEYDFSSLGAKGLKTGYFFHYGSGMEINKKSVSEHEHDILVTYAFPQEKLKGLSFKMKYGMYRNDKALRESINKEENDLRIWVDYKFIIF